MNSINFASTGYATKKEFSKPQSRVAGTADTAGTADIAEGYQRIQNEAGLVITGPAFVRGNDSIHDMAIFSSEALEALEALGALETPEDLALTHQSQPVSDGL